MYSVSGVIIDVLHPQPPLFGKVKFQRYTYVNIVPYC